MVIEYFEAQLLQVFRGNPQIKEIKPVRNIGHAETSMEVLFEDNTRIRVDLHRLRPDEEEPTEELPVVEETECRPIVPGDIYDFSGTEVRILRIEDDHVVFEETAQSAPLMGWPLTTFHKTLTYVRSGN